MDKHILFLNIFIWTFLHCVLQTPDEVAFVEWIKTHYRSTYFWQAMRVNFGSSDHTLISRQKEVGKVKQPKESEVRTWHNDTRWLQIEWGMWWNKKRFSRTLTQVLPRDQQNLVINVSIVVDEKLNKLDHEDVLLVEGIRKGFDTGGIPSLCSGSGRVCRIVEALSYPKLKSKCAHEVICLVESAISSINYRSHSVCVAGERGYDAEKLRAEALAPWARENQGVQRAVSQARQKRTHRGVCMCL